MKVVYGVSYSSLFGIMINLFFWIRFVIGLIILLYNDIKGLFDFVLWELCDGKEFWKCWELMF